MPNKDQRARPIAVVMNMFYTGLGIARTLGAHGIRVIGLSSHRGACGNFTRYAKVYSAPDSKKQPDQLLPFLLDLGRATGNRCVIFPTRDADVLFLARFRDQLQPFFDLVLPGTAALDASLNKWETFRAAQAAGVPSPRCWNIHSKSELIGLAREFRFPCVLKPVSADHWRKEDNWKLVGHRKAIGVGSIEELIAEYDNIAGSESRALIQEMIPGGDEFLWIAACYLNRNSEFVAGFTAQKLIQVPEGFGTGCLVQTAHRPDLLLTAARFLEKLGFSGIAEVEFKWDAASCEYKLIEINPRPWDQHRLGQACGVDLIHIAYCDFANLPVPRIPAQSAGDRWIAEDVFSWLLLRSLFKRDGKFLTLWRMAKGRRVYSMWSRRDPFPSLIFFATSFLPDLVVNVVRHLHSRFSGRVSHRRELTYAKLKN